MVSKPWLPLPMLSNFLGLLLLLISTLVSCQDPKSTELLGNVSALGSESHCHQHMIKIKANKEESIDNMVRHQNVDMWKRFRIQLRLHPCLPGTIHRF